MKRLGIIKAARVFESPLLWIWQFECSVHIFRGPWLIVCRLVDFFFCLWHNLDPKRKHCPRVNTLGNLTTSSVKLMQGIGVHQIALITKRTPPIYLNWYFFPVWNQLDIFASFMARVKYFDGPCLTFYSLFTIYRDIHYQLLVW